MSIEEWQAFRDSLEIEVPARQKAVERPDEPVFDALEVSSGFRLPASYREFIRVFGPGELGEGFLVKAPGLSQTDPHCDLQCFTERTREAVVGNYPGNSRLARMWYFCKTTGGDLIGWDPDEVSDVSRREYRIYIKVHERSTAEPLCENFDEFVGDVCFGTVLDRILGIDPDLSRTFVRRFRPACWWK